MILLPTTEKPTISNPQIKQTSINNFIFRIIHGMRTTNLALTTLRNKCSAPGSIMKTVAHFKIDLPWLGKVGTAECVTVIQQKSPVGDVDRLKRFRPVFA